MSTLHVQPGSRRRRDAPRSDGLLAPIPGERFGFDEARHLLWRAGFGGTPAETQALVELGPEAAVAALLDPPGEPEPAPRFRASIISPPTPEEQERYRRARQSRDEEALAALRMEREERERLDRSQMRDIQRWWLRRMIDTRRPMVEKMTLFWHGHFATSFRKVADSHHMLMQNELFRREALGSFAALLGGIIRDPAMLAFLDNQGSRAGSPNENLARELMELFSLGEGNYTERDIKEGARALTGYGYDDDRFVLRLREHDQGPKTILGARGRLDGDGFVAAILRQNACSRFIARKVYRLLVEDIPMERGAADAETERVIAGLAATLASERYSLRPMLRRLLLSEAFYQPRVMGERIKSPVELVVGAVRTLGTPVRDEGVLIEACTLMGQALFAPPSVKGWDGGRSWINTSTLYVRQNVLAFLLTGRMPAGMGGGRRPEPYDPAPLLSDLSRMHPGAERQPGVVVDYLLRFALGRAPADAARTLTQFASAGDGSVPPPVLSGLLLLITAMPEYQLC
jgi:hypothetical protein